MLHRRIAFAVALLGAGMAGLTALAQDARDYPSKNIHIVVANAAEAGYAFGDVEHEVPALTGHEPGRERAHVADSVDGVAERFEGAGDGVDRSQGIELGDGVLSEAERQIVVLQIVGEPDPHVASLSVARDRAG